ncbi:MAG: hypothetical protein MZV70_37155 [Desulfobacterales bacterium]|nr:hypothetical protein [Desulfobacterales bacterium]
MSPSSPRPDPIPTALSAPIFLARSTWTSDPVVMKSAGRKAGAGYREDPYRAACPGGFRPGQPHPWPTLARGRRSGIDGPLFFIPCPLNEEVDGSNDLHGPPADARHLGH